MLVALGDVLAEATKRRELRSPAEPSEPSAPRKVSRPRKPKDIDTSRQAEKRLRAQAKAKKTREKKAREQRRQAAERNKAARQARSAQIRKKAAPEKPPGLDTVPAQIAHCMMAVHVKRGKSKEAAWNICRWAMTKYGYLKGPYRRNGKMPKTTKQTQKGVTRSFQHGMEKAPLNGGLKGNGPSKFKKFKAMFKDLEPKMVRKAG